MKIKEILLSDDIQRIEREIINAHKGIGIRYRDKDYSNFACLLEIRKDLINKKVLKFQEDLIPEIVEFNETLHNALRKMYDKAYHIYMDRLSKTSGLGRRYRTYSRMLFRPGASRETSITGGRQARSMECSL